MDNRRHRSSRIDRWLREVSDTDRQAAPLDFAEVAALSQHTCDPAGSIDGGAAIASLKICTLRPPEIAGDCAPQQHQQLLQQPPSQSLPLRNHNRAGLADHADDPAAPSISVSVVKQQQQQPLPPVSDSPLSTGSSSSSASLDFTSTESNTELKQSSQSSSLASSLDSNKMKVVRREHHQQQLPPQWPQHQQRAQQPAQQPAQQQAQQPTKQQEHSHGQQTDKAAAATAGSNSKDAAGVTYYFYLSKGCSKERSQELLGQLKALRESDQPMQHTADSRGVSIALGRSVEPVPGESSAGYRRKVVIQGSNWRSVMESVNDLSQLFPDLMSQQAAATSAAGKAQAETPPPPAPLPLQQQQQQHQQPPRQPEHQPAASKPRKLESRPSQQQQQQQQKPSAHQSASGTNSLRSQAAPVASQAPPTQLSGIAAVAAAAGASHLQSIGRQAKLAQNVRFQLTTQQRESLFTQDEAGKPTHPRLKNLLSTLRMDLVFLERSVNTDNVPSVKVRFFFESFEQLTSFCKAIDYQIPSQS